MNSKDLLYLLTGLLVGGAAVYLSHKYVGFPASASTANVSNVEAINEATNDVTFREGKIVYPLGYRSKDRIILGNRKSI